MAILWAFILTDLELFRDAPNQALGPSTGIRSADGELYRFSAFA